MKVKIQLFLDTHLENVWSVTIAFMSCRGYIAGFTVFNVSIGNVAMFGFKSIVLNASV